MGREVRMVPADWQHPKEWNAFRNMETYKPLFDRDWADAAKEWDAEREAWERGELPEYADAEDALMPYDQWAGQRPFSGDYMPNWPKDQRTHYMMYEDTSEGTPISPAFETPEELAEWLVDNNASAFAGQTATYDAWLRVANGGFAPSMIIQDGHMMSGVEGLAMTPAPQGDR